MGGARPICVRRRPDRGVTRADSTSIGWRRSQVRPAILRGRHAMAGEGGIEPRTGGRNVERH